MKLKIISYFTAFVLTTLFSACQSTADNSIVCNNGLSAASLEECPPPRVSDSNGSPCWDGTWVFKFSDCPGEPKLVPMEQKVVIEDDTPASPDALRFFLEKKNLAHRAI